MSPPQPIKMEKAAANTNLSGYPHKRPRHSPPAISPSENDIPDLLVPASKKEAAASSFRNVSACNRCRLRKNRCDQKLPSCASCEKAGVKCVGYDPITKREIPRSYVFYLESRVGYLEQVLKDHGIPFAAAEVLDLSSRPGADPNTAHTPSDEGLPPFNGTALTSNNHSKEELAWNKKRDESEKLNKLISNVGSVSVQGASDSRYLGSTSGISFARVVFAAVKSSVSGANSEKSGVRPSRPPVTKAATGSSGTSMRDSFFGLHTKPTIKQAPFPDKEVGQRLVDFYFEHANPQIPILHRGEFMKMFELAYREGEERVRTPRELYMLNIVFAIGSGIFLGDDGGKENGDRNGNGNGNGNKKEEESRRARFGAGKQCQPEEYHASAIVHLESCLSNSSSLDTRDGFGGGLEELQAVLLLAGFALLRPVAPGLWYIIGVAVRLAVDLGLHYEDGKDIEVGLDGDETKIEDTDNSRLQRERAAREKGRREWVRDFRRRLWWCTYSFDRLVSTCVGRPFGITDQVVTTEFPSLLDDKYITPGGFLDAPAGEPSYKHAAYHYFRLRLLQSEILQVLQHQQAEVARAGGVNLRNPYMHTSLPSPFLSKFDSFRSWRIDIDKRLWEWKTSAPTKSETGVAFSIEFLELNYWQAVIMLYRQSLSVPPMFEGEYNTSEEVQSPNVHNVELREDEERVFLKVAEAGQRVLRLYRQLHRVHLVNYTFLATHHLFMAGISFLYAIWHSPIVRSRLTMDEVDFTILAATSVLGDLIEKCPPAEACRDAFDRMSKATVQMCMSTTGFSSSSASGLHSRHGNDSSSDYFSNKRKRLSSQIAKFDMGLNDLLGPTVPIERVRSPPAQRGERENGGKYAPARQATNQSISQPQAQNQNQSQSAMHSPIPTEYSMSPPYSTFEPPNPQNQSLDPSLQQSPTSYSSLPAGNQLPYTNNPSNPNPNQNPNQNHNNNTTTVPNHWNFQAFEAPGMDWLPQPTTSNSNANGVANGLNGWDYNTDGGDLGMGLGWEGIDHDFSEGGGGMPDLFEGFFFGGSGNF